MAQRIVEMVIGRLITDEEFRCEFIRDPEATLNSLCERGMDLSRAEIAALVSTDPALWVRTAERIDPRLQKASLKNGNEETGPAPGRCASRPIMVCSTSVSRPASSRRS